MASDPSSGLASRLYRGAGENSESREIRARENLSHQVVYFAILAATLIFFGDLLSVEVARWRDAVPSVPLHNSDWKLLVNPPSASCALTGIVDASCPANPASPLLWKNGESRFDEKGFRKRKAKKDFWVGAEFSPEMARHAYDLQANQLLLGWVYSDYDLFLNGQWVNSGLIEERQAAVVQIPLALLHSGEPVKIAVLIHPDSEGGNPDYFADPWVEGLATAKQATAFRSANVFYRSAKPLGLFLLNLLFSVMFFLFWQMQKRKQEYFYFALYGAIGALVQVKYMDIFRGSLDLPATHALELFLFTAEGGFGLLTALSFSRGRREVFNFFVPALLIVPWFAMLLPIGVKGRHDLIGFIKLWLVPALYFAGSAVCLLQAYHLVSLGKNQRFTARVRQLTLFALGMGLIGAISFAEGHGHISLITQAMTSRFTHFSVVLLLAIIAMREYREERQLLERSPISKYHRRPQLSEAIRGALLCVDIKDSEHLSQESAASTGDSGRLVRACLTHMWGAVLAEKGSVLSTEGDGLHAFFDADDCENPAESALRTADRMRERLGELARQLHAQGLHNGSDLGFRAGLAVGEIKPVWQEVDRVKVAGWSDTGTGKIFVESARLMEIERQTGSGKDTCQVVLGADTAFALRSLKNLQGSWVLEAKKFVGKHDRSYLVSVYAPYRGTNEESEDSICMAG